MTTFPAYTGSVKLQQLHVVTFMCVCERTGIIFSSLKIAKYFFLAFSLTSEHYFGYRPT